VIAPRARVIVDNDFSGDPDDLFQLLHHVLSPSVEIPLIIGSKLPANDPFDPSDRQATNAVAVAAELLEVMGRGGDYRIEQGSNVSLSDPSRPIRSAAAEAIVEEAMRDSELPLYIALGAGMTELANAFLIEPRIADRLTAVWIGGNEHEGHALPPANAMPVEYNLSIDVLAAQVVFNDSTIPIWQVPRNVYRQCLVSYAELEARVRPMGAAGAYLVEAIDRVGRVAGEHGLQLGETYALGDSPLVLLTALQSAFEPDTSSSRHVTMPTPILQADGSYGPNPTGRPMRVYTHVDTRLMFEDFYCKLAASADGGI
jgi:inosine-uridine nucleoside N-ribohydrolase